MAILQEANAVFYHPLDDLTEALQPQAWAGSSKPKVGKVALAQGQADASVSYGSAGSLPSGGPNATFTDSSGLDATRIVSAMVDINNTVLATAVGTVTGTAIAYGAKNTISSTQATATSIAAVSPTKFVVVHGPNSRVGTVSGTDITVGANATIPGSPDGGGGAESYTEVAALSASVVVATYRSGSPVNTVKAVVGAVGATAVTWGTEVTVATLGTVPWIRVAAMAADRFIVAYGTRVGNDPVFVQGGLVVGTLISLPDAAVEAATAFTGTVVGGFSGQKRVAIVSTSERDAMLGYFGQGSPDSLLVRAISMPATAVAVGPASIMSDPVGTDQPNRGLGEPLGEMTMAWDGSHVAVTHVTQFLEGSTTGGVGSREVVTHLVSLNPAGLPVERARAQPFQNDNISDTRSASAAVAPGKFAVSSLWFSTVTTKVGDVTPRALSAAGTDGTTAFGAETEFRSTASDYISAASLDSSTFVVAYRGLGDHGQAKVGTVSGTDITFGAEAEFLSTGLVPDYISVAALSTTKFVVAYQDGADSGHGTAKVGTVAGTDITFGAEAEFLSAGAVRSVSVAALDAGKFVVAYRDDADSGHGTAKVGTVAGTDITFGAEAEFNGAGITTYISAAALSATAFVVCYRDTADSDHGTAKAGTVSGTDITFGAEAEFGAGGASYISAAALDASRFVVAYRDDADSDHGTAKIGTVSGTDITFGAEAEFNGAGYTSHISAAALGTARFAVTYADFIDSSHGTAKIGTVSGTDITFGAEAEFAGAGAVRFVSVAALDAGKFVVAYTDDADSGHGTAKVGTAYPSAVGATRLAFSSWTRCGLDMSVGTSVVFPIDQTPRLAVTALSDTSFLAVYVNSVNHGVARVFTLSGTSLATGPESIIVASLGAAMDVTALSPTKVVAVTAGTTGGRRSGFVGTVAGTDVTWAAGAEFDSGLGLGDPILVETVDAFRVLLVFSRSASPFDRITMVGTVIGTTLSWGPQSVASGGSAGSAGGLVVLNEFTAVATHLTFIDPAITDVSLQLVAISGSVATWTGPIVSPPELRNMVDQRIAAIDSSRFLIAYNDNTDKATNFTEPEFRQTFARVVTVAGTDFTLGPDAQLDGSPVEPSHLVRVHDDRFLLAYVRIESGVTRTLYGATVTVSGTTVTFAGTRVAVTETGTSVWLHGVASSGGTAVLLSTVPAVTISEASATAVAVMP